MSLSSINIVTMLILINFSFFASLLLHFALYQYCFDYSGSHAIPYEFGVQLFHFFKKSHCYKQNYCHSFLFSLFLTNTCSALAIRWALFQCLTNSNPPAPSQTLIRSVASGTLGGLDTSHCCFISLL
uniref:Uncharacterized protein n=1 Tax=Rousettus aegyptiacus TaxID=9407 RepID=A0A7J8BED0_ROUAE|nr:hypothetical protein HJG63_009869 [Rousettus aegyptiacus]